MRLKKHKARAYSSSIIVCMRARMMVFVLLFVPIPPSSQKTIQYFVLATRYDTPCVCAFVSTTLCIFVAVLCVLFIIYIALESKSTTHSRNIV